MKKRAAVFCALLLAVMTILPVGSPVYASLTDTETQTDTETGTESSTSMDIVNKEDEMEQTQSDLEDAEASKETMEQTKIELEGYLGELNSKLEELSENINSLEEQIAAKESEIEAIQNDLALAKEDETEQYEEMKKRIQFMYEQGGMTLYAALLTGGGISDMISKTEYIAQVSRYDRQMLEKYQETKENIADNESTLLAEQTELDAMQASLKEQQDELEETIESTTENISLYEAEIASAELQIQAFEEQLAQQEAELGDLEALQEAEAIAANSNEVKEAAQKAQEIANNLTSSLTALGFSVNTVTVTYEDAYAASASDLVLLATIIYCEAGGECFEGKCAVGACVMNRVRSSEFPNTILGVIYQAGQFTPVSTGRFALALAQGVPDECYEAAQMALDGYNNIGDYLYFRTPNGVVQGLQIGGHIFHDGSYGF